MTIKEKQKAYHKAYSIANADRIRAYKKEYNRLYWQNHREEKRAYNKAYRIANIDRIKAYQKAYREKGFKT